MKTFLSLCLFTNVLLAQKVDYKTQIWPVIEKKCLDCHNDRAKHPLNKSPKGGLQLDTPEMVLKGGSGGPIVISGKPDESSFYTLTILPPDHEDVMPSKGDPLTKQEQELFKNWILQGIDFGVKIQAPVKVVSVNRVEDRYDVLAEKTKPALEADINFFRERKYFIQAVKEDGPLLKLDFIMKQDIKSEDFSKISSLKGQLVYLNLARTNVKDSDLVVLKGLRKLLYLHLEKNSLSDAAIENLTSLSSLQYLNLVDNKLTDKAVDSLAKLQSLQKLYLWNSGISKAGATKLKKALPNTNVNIGD
jgi:hypothetical protein